MGELDKLGSEFRISINPDESGFVGRECPNVSCHKYFKIRPGTGLTGPNLPCICPYCGHVAHRRFLHLNKLNMQNL